MAVTTTGWLQVWFLHVVSLFLCGLRSPSPDNMNSGERKRKEEEEEVAVERGGGRRFLALSNWPLPPALTRCSRTCPVLRSQLPPGQPRAFPFSPPPVRPPQGHFRHLSPEVSWDAAQPDPAGAQPPPAPFPSPSLHPGLGEDGSQEGPVGSREPSPLSWPWDPTGTHTSPSPLLRSLHPIPSPGRLQDAVDWSTSRWTPGNDAGGEPQAAGLRRQGTCVTS